jgi:hypothetical protein
MQWANISSRIFIWDCKHQNCQTARTFAPPTSLSSIQPLLCADQTNFQDYVQPFPNWLKVGQDIEWLAKHRVKGLFAQGSYASSGGDMDILKAYLVGTMLAPRPQGRFTGLRTEAVVAAWLEAYFGRAAPMIQSYFDIMRGSLTNAPTGHRTMTLGFSATEPFLKPMSMLLSAQAFKDARSSAKGKYRRRVDVAKLPVYSVILQRWTEMRNFSVAYNVPWPLEATLQEAFAEWSRVCHQAGIWAVSSNCPLDCFRKLVFKSDDSQVIKLVVGTDLGSQISAGVSDGTAADELRRLQQWHAEAS